MFLNRLIYERNIAETCNLKQINNIDTRVSIVFDAIPYVLDTIVVDAAGLKHDVWVAILPLVDGSGQFGQRSYAVPVLRIEWR